MLQTLKCSRFGCKHNHNGFCYATIVDQEEKPIPIWNVTYTECKTFEEQEEE